MPARFLNDHPDVLTVIMTNLAVIGFTFTDVEVGLKILSLVLVIGYTVWKWHRDWSKEKQK